MHRRDCRGSASTASGSAARSRSPSASSPATCPTSQTSLCLQASDASETIGRMVEFFPAVKQPLIRSILAGVLRGVVSQRLLPRNGGGRIPAVEIMIGNARIADLIRDNKPDEITEAIAEGDFFQMQTFSKALIELVLEEKVDREVAANAASNRHDFLIALDRALKQQAVETVADLESVPTSDAEDAPEPEPTADETGDEATELPRLRVA